jgi:hypothetical protein
VAPWDLSCLNRSEVAQWEEKCLNRKGVGSLGSEVAPKEVRRLNRNWDGSMELGASIGCEVAP